MAIKIKLTAGLIGALLMFLTPGSSPVRAQEASAAYVVSHVEVVPSVSVAAIALLGKLREASRQEPGNLSFVVLRRIGQPEHFAILESWNDAGAHAAHAAASGAAFVDQLKASLAAPIDERVHVGFAAGSSKVPGHDAVYALTHVDFIGTKKDEGLAALKQLTADDAAEPGNLSADVWQQNNRPNHLTLIEVWHGKAAFEAHVTAEHTRKYRNALLPMIGALYDQRLYMAIE